MSDYVYTLYRADKFYGPERQVLSNISLSFLHGAKIGVLGPNGSGKSSLLKIMAGVDKDFLGEAQPMPGLRIGYLPQEPQLDPAKDVRGNVEDGVAETRDLLRRFEEVSAKFGEPLSDDEMTALMEEQGKLQDRIDAANAAEIALKRSSRSRSSRTPSSTFPRTSFVASSSGSCGR